MIHKGDLIINKEKQHKFKNISEVTGYLRIYEDAKLDVPMLETVVRE